MRLRRRRFRASVAVNDEVPQTYPIIIGFGPALGFEATVEEAATFATELVDAIEEARRRS